MSEVLLAEINQLKINNQQYLQMLDMSTTEKQATEQFANELIQQLHRMRTHCLLLDKKSKLLEQQLAAEKTKVQEAVNQLEKLNSELQSIQTKSEPPGELESQIAA